MKLVDTPIALAELAVMVEEGFGDLTKAVVDIRVGVMVVDGRRGIAPVESTTLGPRQRLCRWCS